MCDFSETEKNKGNQEREAIKNTGSNIGNILVGTRWAEGWKWGWGLRRHLLC